MMKLYPPILDMSLPAALISDIRNGDEGVFTIPYKLNRGISEDDINGCMVLIQNIQGKQIGHVKIEKNRMYNPLIVLTDSTDKLENEHSGAFIWDEPQGFILDNSYYKILMAFIGKDNVVGYYSQPAVVKLTWGGWATIDYSKRGITNNIEVLGSYTLYDFSEKPYSYHFNLFDETGKLIESTGEVLHNATKDDNNQDSVYDKFIITSNIIPGKHYTIEYRVKTINGLILTSTKELLGYDLPLSDYWDQDSNSSKIDISYKIDNKNGCVSVYFSKKDKTNTDALVVNGTFELIRTDERSDFRNWVRIKKIKMYGFNLTNNIKSFIYSDNSVEHGIKYKYSLRQINENGFVSKPLSENNDIFQVFFEDMFLFDGEKQLRIPYNPKVTSYKTNILQTKTDTIGSKYPFFFRNGAVEYKEFPISGLISYWMDEEENFCSWDDLGLIPNENGIKIYNKDKTRKNDRYKDVFSYETTNLTNENILGERLFKQKVLDFLNSPKPKLFRSPVEGNHIVNLMNVSLTPNDQLGRMLHTFNCTAYEIANANNISDLINYNFLIVGEDMIKSSVYIKNVIYVDGKFYKPSSQFENGNLVDSLEIIDNALEVGSSKEVAVELNIEYALPGSKFYIQTKQNNKRTYIIGATGELTLVPSDGDFITSINPLFTSSQPVYLNIKYQIQEISAFDLITDLGLKNIQNLYLNYFDFGHINDYLEKRYNNDYNKVEKYLGEENIPNYFKQLCDNKNYFSSSENSLPLSLFHIGKYLMSSQEPTADSKILEIKNIEPIVYGYSSDMNRYNVEGEEKITKLSILDTNGNILSDLIAYSDNVNLFSCKEYVLAKVDKNSFDTQKNEFYIYNKDDGTYTEVTDSIYDPLEKYYMRNTLSDWGSYKILFSFIDSPILENQKNTSIILGFNISYTIIDLSNLLKRG